VTERIIGVDQQAANCGIPVEQEMLLYVIHGCLHLCGYDDKSAKAAKEMRTKEREYLKVIGVPDVTDRE
jgi:probable rRNA maturation factor